MIPSNKESKTPNLPCFTCDHLMNSQIIKQSKNIDNIYEIPCRFFKSPTLQIENEDCVGWIKKEEMY